MMQYIVLLTTTLVYASAHHETTGPYRAIAWISSPDHRVVGNITFTQLQDGTVQIEGSIAGLNPGQYGFHVHEKGDITGGCGTTGGHFNPEHKQHGHPGDQNRHVGDLGNVVFDSSHIARIDFTDGMIALTGVHGILGRAVVLHEREDDFGRSEHPDSKKTGNAGGRVACGVIGILSPLDGWNNSGSSISPYISVILVPLALVVLFNKNL